MSSDARSQLHADLLSNLGWVRRVARAIVHDEAAADDLAQEVVRVALERREPLVGAERGLRAWLRRVARTLALDRARSERARRARELSVSRSERDDDTAEIVERGWRQQRVAQAVLELAEPYRTTVLLRYLDELSTAEVAARMQASEATTRQRLSRGLELLRGKLDSEFECDTRTWALALLAPSNSAAASIPSAMVMQGAGVVSAKWIGAAVAVVVLGFVLWRGASDASSPSSSEAATGTPSLVASLTERAPAPIGPATPAAEVRGATDARTLVAAGRATSSVSDAVTILRVRVKDSAGATLVAGQLDCAFARERHVQFSPSTVRTRVPIAGEITEFRLPASAVAAEVSASVAGARGSATVEVAPLRPAEAAKLGEVVHDVVIALDVTAAPPALTGAIFVDGARRAPRGLQLRYSANHVIGEQPRVNTLDASYVLDEVAGAGGRLWVTSDETAPRNFELDAETVASGALDLELGSGRTLSLTLIDRVSDTPLCRASFHVRRDIRLHDNVWDSDQRTYRTDDHGQCEIVGLPSEGSVTILPDTGPLPRAVIFRNSEPLTQPWLNEPWWLRRLKPEDPERLAVTLRVTLGQDGATAFGYVPPSLRGGRDHSERVRVAARELNLAYDPEAPPAERLQERGDAFELPVDADGRWELVAPFPSRYVVWLERSSSRAKLSDEVEVALDAAGAVGPIELKLSDALAVEVRFEHVPPEGDLSLTIAEPGASPRTEQVACGGGACSHSIQLTAASDVTVEWTSRDDRHLKLQRRVRIDPARETARTIDFGDGDETRAVRIALVPRGVELRGDEMLAMLRLDAADAPTGDALFVPVRDGVSLRDVPLANGRWLYAYLDRPGTALILGVCNVDAATTSLRLEPEVLAKARDDLGQSLALREVDGVVLGAEGAFGRPVPTPAGEGPLWLSATLRYDSVP
ncbi:MAG: sigma-70 family RNA polymerase sigma factor [Planctomycetes bacterium]|nr:sigma-70 family RNA polymerase sigma factor [Planctomycetota bacterium]